MPRQSTADHSNPSNSASVHFTPGAVYGNLELIGPVTYRSLFSKYPRDIIVPNKYLARCLGPGEDGDGCPWEGEVYRQYIAYGTRKGRCCGNPACDPERGSGDKKRRRPKVQVMRERMATVIPVLAPVGRLLVTSRRVTMQGAYEYVCECLECGESEVITGHGSHWDVLAAGCLPCPGCGSTAGRPGCAAQLQPAQPPAPDRSRDRVADAE